MMVRFSSGEDIEHGPLYVEVASVRLLVKNLISPNGGSILYQQGSDYPILVQEDVEEAYMILKNGQGKV